MAVHTPIIACHIIRSFQMLRLQTKQQHCKVSSNTYSEILPLLSDTKGGICQACFSFTLSVTKSTSML